MYHEFPLDIFAEQPLTTFSSSWPEIHEFFRFFVKVLQYKFFETTFFAETAENGRRSGVWDGEKRKSANFGLHTTKTEVRQPPRGYLLSIGNSRGISTSRDNYSAPTLGTSKHALFNGYDHAWPQIDFELQRRTNITVRDLMFWHGH